MLVVPTAGLDNGKVQRGLVGGFLPEGAGKGFAGALIDFESRQACGKSCKGLAEEEEAKAGLGARA